MIERHNRRFSRRSTERKMTYRLGLKATQLQEHVELLELLRKAFGGQVFVSRRLKNKGNRREICVWQITGKRAYLALQAMFPYLQVKADVAFLGMLQWLAHEQHMETRRNKSELNFDFKQVCEASQRAVSYFNGKNRPRGVQTQIN